MNDEMAKEGLAGGNVVMFSAFARGGTESE
jgi:hypothetical protein